MGKLLIVTGMSGAGKTIALKSLEDMGYYCVDNLPIPLIDKFAELIVDGHEQITKAALGIDVRSGRDLPLLKEVLDTWDIRGRIDYEIVFLDASGETLLKRFKETRRAHPLSKDGRVETGIEAERKEMSWLKEKADYIIDTSHLLTKELRGQLADIFEGQKAYENLQVTILSFGFKHGIPEDADLLFDVRFLPNPYYIPELKALTGLDEPVRNFIFQYQQTKDFLEKTEDLLAFLLPNYVDEGKTDLVIAVGCTGGQHRSSCIAKELCDFISKRGYVANLTHRDMSRNRG